MMADNIFFVDIQICYPFLYRNFGVLTEGKNLIF